MHCGGSNMDCHLSSCTNQAARTRGAARRCGLGNRSLGAWGGLRVRALKRNRAAAPERTCARYSWVGSRICSTTLLHDDFSQGQTLKGIGSEKEVQKWAADRLRLKQGRSFSVEREPHVVDEKEPDVRIRAKATDANVSMEIKVAESWSLTELDDALEAPALRSVFEIGSGTVWGTFTCPALTASVPDL